VLRWSTRQTTRGDVGHPHTCQVSAEQTDVCRRAARVLWRPQEGEERTSGHNTLHCTLHISRHLPPVKYTIPQTRRGMNTCPWTKEARLRACSIWGAEEDRGRESGWGVWRMKKKPSMTPVFIPNLNAGRCYRNTPIYVPTRYRRVIPGSTPRSIVPETRAEIVPMGRSTFCADERGKNYTSGSAKESICKWWARGGSAGI
jgi:hypothetical protein